ncbi:hypothetical protein SEA_TOMAS_146 [Streptomyces phage Tomas]|uniref:Uncharacterized protein n=1 Tax=Streptomyces phage Tomas TaxID=2914443 RepID=A0AA49BTX9_9CAUD|nr:hypothetical protein PP453_gp151 [Streptomyces phage Tomas]UMO76316.1 hypothetical protein SEA_TOMAS_146 [Streptomyces phage Tomas]
MIGRRVWRGQTHEDSPKSNKQWRSYEKHEWKRESRDHD